MGTISLAIGIIFLAIFSSMKREKSALALVILSFLLVMRVLSQTHLRQFGFDALMFWEYIRVFLAIATPMSVMLVACGILDRAGKKICLGFIVIYAAYLIVFIDGTTIVAFIVFFVLVSGPGLRGNEEASLLTINPAVMFVFALCY